jgi:hypothetical protein
MNNQDISTELLSRPDLLKDTLKGINKSFSEAGIDEAVAPVSLISFEELVRLLIPALEDLYFKKHHQFKLLLYRVDISEEMLQKNLKDKNQEYILSTVAELIIKRELQKAVLRQFYRNNQESKGFENTDD